MTSVDSKVVFITGGGHGSGAEGARRLHAKGAKLGLTDLDAAARATISGELGGDERILTVVADVCNLAAMNSAAEQAVHQTMRELQEMRREQASSLVIPDAAGAALPNPSDLLGRGRPRR